MRNLIEIYGAPVLRQEARELHIITDGVIELADRMTKVMVEANGLGLAGPQVGESARIICVRELSEDSDGEDTLYCLINPRIVESEGEQEGMEGCLSLPTLYGTVLRDETVVVEGIDLEGETIQIQAEGLLARALQHEIDHLEGVLFTDLVEPDSLKWRVPDEDAEDGYRFEPTTIDEIGDRFERLRKSRERKQ